MCRAGGTATIGRVDPLSLATTAATSIVGLLATEAWEKAREVVTALWRKVHPDRVETVVAELEDTRAEVLAARRDGDERSERDLAGEWQGRLRRLMAADPAIAEELARLLTDVLEPAARAHGGTIAMNATAHDHGRVYQAGRDQHITGG
jgi:hypothetical protein